MSYVTDPRSTHSFSSSLHVCRVPLSIHEVETTTLDSNSPHNLHLPIKSPTSQNSNSDACKSVTPNRLKVPKAFKNPERYTSPTDLMMSPVSRGLLARSRKPSARALTSLQESSQPSEFATSGSGTFCLRSISPIISNVEV